MTTHKQIAGVSRQLASVGLVLALVVGMGVGVWYVSHGIPPWWSRAFAAQSEFITMSVVKIFVLPGTQWLYLLISRRSYKPIVQQDCQDNQT